MGDKVTSGEKRIRGEEKMIKRGYSMYVCTPYIDIHRISIYNKERGYSPNKYINKITLKSYITSYKGIVI